MVLWIWRGMVAIVFQGLGDNVITKETQRRLYEQRRVIQKTIKKGWTSCEKGVMQSHCDTLLLLFPVRKTFILV